MLYLVTYDLNTPGQNYEQLYRLLKSVDHCHPLESVWIIKTNLSVEKWAEKIRAVCTSNDSIYVVDITDQNQYGYLEDWDCIYKLQELE